MNPGIAAPSAATVLTLPDMLDLNAAAPLAAKFRVLRGRPVAVDASGVQKLGGLCLQVLLSASVTWAVDNVPLRVVDASSAFREGAALFGASPLTL